MKSRIIHNYDKGEIRKLLSEKRNQLSYSERERYSSHITNTLLSLDDIANAKCVHCYKSFGAEVTTSDFINELLSRKKIIYVPVVNDDILLHAEINYQTQWKKDRFGIPTPIAPSLTVHEMRLEENDCIIIPMLGYDSQCMRLGYGKGFYDKFLSATKGKKIGLAFSCQYYEIIPSDVHDIAMDIIITETGVFFHDLA